MNKKHLLIILLLWSFVGSAKHEHSTENPYNPLKGLRVDANNSPFEGGLRGMFYAAATNPGDSVKTKKANASQLKYLQQLNILRAKTPLPIGSPLKGTIVSANNTPFQGRSRGMSILPENIKTFRAFPSLDQKILENNNFNIALANSKPEFTPEFITANFESNPKVDTLLAQATKAFEELKKLGNFVDILTGKELLELPVGLRKKDSTSGNTVELAIVQVKFTPQYAEFKAWGKLTIPEKGPNGESERNLYFGAEGIKLSHDGAILGDMKLVLLGNQAIPIHGDNWLLTLKGGINLETGAFGDQSYIEFDCSGLKSIGLEGDLRISRNVLLPITSGGNYTCGDSRDNQYLKDKEDLVNNKCYVGASFSVQANGWNDVLLEVTLPKFEVVGLKGWGFNVKRAVLDLSDTKNASGIKFPKEYSALYTSSTRKLWRGFYAKEISIMLPKGIENTKTNDGRVEFGATDLIIDSQGVSGTFYGENVLNVGEGAAGKWAFTVEDVSITLAMNSVAGGSMAGDVSVPILKEPMEYDGYISSTGWGLEVGRKSDYQAPVFLGEILLAKNSRIGIDVKEGNVYPYANLTGELSIAGKINQKEGEEQPKQEEVAADSKGFTFPGIKFEELKLETEPGKKPISAKSFGFTGEMKLMGFPATVSDLALVTSNNEVGLSFDLSINLDGEGSHATTSMNILGKLADGAKIQEWKFSRVKVDGIAIDYKKSGVALKGSLEIMEDHSWYGDGFRGSLTATIKDLDFSATGKAIFGKKDFRYWNVDIWTDKTTGTGATKLPIKSFVGGISYKMKKIRGNGDGFSPSSAVYRPNIDYGLGIRAGVKITTENEGTFAGKAYLEMEFNTHGGLNRIGFMGEGAFMGDKKGFKTENENVEVGKVFSKVSDFIENNKETADKLLKYGNFLGLSQEAIPVRDVASTGGIGVYIGIEKDFVNGTFDGEFELYIDLEGIKGGGADNLAGYAKIHTGPDDWYLYLGTPQRRIELIFNAGAQIRVGGYFMTGTVLPAQLDPHPTVVKILGDDMLNGNRQENQLAAGKGFAFGLNFGYGYNFDWKLFYAFVEVGAGFDVMHAYYPNAKCVGRQGPIGNNGWYSMGQVYAYIYGEFGVKVDLAFIKGKFVIAEAGVAAMLRGQFPNPVYIQGYVGMYYKILGGLVKGNMRLKVQMGEECELENINNAVGVPMISDITPRDNSDDVSVFAAPQAIFNYAANEDFTVNLDDGNKTFKLRLKSFTVTSEGKQLAGELEWNETNDAVTFKPSETLPSEKEVKILVEVSFDEKIGGSYQTVIQNGKPAVEKLEAIFKTDKAPDHIPLENIAYLYPVLDQESFYPEEYNKGYVKMVTPQNYLFESGYEMRAEFVAKNTGQGIRTNLSYDKGMATVFYDIPDMDLNNPYELNLMAFPPGADIQTEIVVVETDAFSDDENTGDTNWYNVDSNSQDKETVNKTGSAVISSKKAANVTISNGSPKSILMYSFKTSKHNTFKDKVRDLDVTNNLTNFIYADVHSLSIKVADYEYLSKMEILGNKYTGEEPLIYAQAILDDNYYKQQIYGLLYEKYPLDGNIRVDREEEILGLPPIRSFYIGNEYLDNIDNNASSTWVKNRIPFVYNLPYQYKIDMIYLRNKIVNRYTNSGGDQAKYDSYKYLIQSSFPPLPLGNFKAQLIYRTPGNLYQKGYEIKYRND
tara:strand:- start:56035 stop:61071 length:5037 start_codon:yes stop_codon:yes gene_type:complete